MPNDKFKGCFIDESDLYAYDITFDGELLAKAHTLSARNRSDIERNSMKKAFVDGEFTIDVDSHAHKTYTILNAVTEWYLPRPLNADNIGLLSEKLREHLFEAIQTHEKSVTEAVETTEKN